MCATLLHQLRTQACFDMYASLIFTQRLGNMKCNRQEKANHATSWKPHLVCYMCKFILCVHGMSTRKIQETTGIRKMVGIDLKQGCTKAGWRDNVWDPPSNSDTSKLLVCNHNWSRGVTVSTLDSESSDRGPNLREPWNHLLEQRSACGANCCRNPHGQRVLRPSTKSPKTNSIAREAAL